MAIRAIGAITGDWVLPPVLPQDPARYGNATDDARVLN
jgi:hypothetical protein